ncbi:SMP-30/gluconolactonase/LRE family protein [Pseudozobellia thermophila]|uniref:SMP-30/Gluconolaconase/LRE-like region-containing protein n=1 Tax=Pseudozobellia thermophila TaxID=192903 RepID=A0A1M6MYH7_9FLAO|nr:SMP-30/gluconolactonase/LRE family protein [Pseudozobellia thermophila]SHJ88496.1 SMP-30/Gluconolaconase/LRE-like region-containing protein [Pseudozobellia thermophila]
MKTRSQSFQYSCTKLVRGVVAATLFSTLGPVANAQIQFPVDVGTKPESITKGFDDKYYVTLMNGKEQGDGQVAEISSSGVRVFSEGFDEPKGIVYLNGNLYLSDITRVWKVDKNGKATVFAKKEDFPEEVLYLNDVAVDADGKGIYVADMGATSYMRDENNQLWPLDSEQAKKIPQLGRIYHIDLNGKISIAQDTSPLLPNPNGVGVDNDGEIMIGAFFLGNFLVKKNGVLTPLDGVYRGADAVEQDSKGDYYISSWALAKVWKIDGKTEKAIVLKDDLESAADFYLEEDKGRLLLPDMLAGKIYAVDINP